MTNRRTGVDLVIWPAKSTNSGIVSAKQRGGGGRCWQWSVLEDVPVKAVIALGAKFRLRVVRNSRPQLSILGRVAATREHDSAMRRDRQRTSAKTSLLVANMQTDPDAARYLGCRLSNASLQLKPADFAWRAIRAASLYPRN